jgi:hypothetical protein
MEVNGRVLRMLAANEREKSKKCPLTLASYLKNYTKVKVPTTAMDVTAGLDWACDHCRKTGCECGDHSRGDRFET